jgi:hypothetical protein
MHHFGRVPLLVLLASCSCKGCVESNPPSQVEDEICLDPSRQSPRNEVCDDLCPPGRRVSWRPVGSATCDSFGEWTASRPNADAFVPLEWQEIAIFGVSTLELLDGEIPGALPGLLADLVGVGPGNAVDRVLGGLESQFDLTPEDTAAIQELIEDALATAEDINPANVCVHVWTGAGEPVDFPPDTEPDCIVAGEAPPPPPPIETDLADAFQSSIGIPGLAPVKTIGGSQAPVMIAVVDTAPPGSGGINAVHGQAVASIIELAGC